MSLKNMALYMANRRKFRRAKLFEMSGNICARCQTIENLEFNHKDRTTKLFNLSGKALDTSWNIIIKEWEKCELLCKTCHLNYTKQQYNNQEIIPWNKDITKPYPEHGSPRMYSEFQCRCSLCKEAKKLYRAKIITYNQNIPG